MHYDVNHMDQKKKNPVFSLYALLCFSFFDNLFETTNTKACLIYAYKLYKAPVLKKQHFPRKQRAVSQETEEKNERITYFINRKETERQTGAGESYGGPA